MKYRVLVIDEEFQVLTNIDFRYLFDFNPTGEIFWCKPDFYATGARFIVGLGDVEVPIEMQTKHVYKGTTEPTSSSWISYFNFDKTSKKLVCTSKEYGAIHIEQERAQSLLAVAPDKILLTTRSN